MKKKFTVDLSTVEKVKDFVYRISKLNSMVFIKRDDGTYADAKSILGVIPESSSHVEVEINTDDKWELDRFGKICRDYQ